MGQDQRRACREEFCGEEPVGRQKEASWAAVETLCSDSREGMQMAVDVCGTTYVTIPVKVEVKSLSHV